MWKKTPPAARKERTRTPHKDTRAHMHTRTHALNAHLQDDLLVAARIGRRAADHRRLPAARQGVALVHPQQVGAARGALL